MIRSWTLEYFKSVFEKTKLEFAPLTIFSGANSSGKTTIIQSLLLTTQTLQNSVNSRPIILNGHIIKMGSFDDIVSNGHKNKSILIDFNLTPMEFKKETAIRLFRTYPFRTIQTLKSVNCSFKFSSIISENDQEITQLQLQPRLEECRINIESNIDDHENEEKEIHIIRTNLQLEERLSKYDLSDDDDNNAQQLDISSLLYEVKKPLTLKANRRYYRTPPQNGKPIGVSLAHFLPDQFAIVFDAIEEQENQLLDLLVSGNIDEYSLYRLKREFSSNEIKIGKELENIIINYIRESEEKMNFNAKSRPKHKFIQNLNILQEHFSLENLGEVYNSLSNKDKQIITQKFALESNNIKNNIKKIKSNNQNYENKLAYFPLSEMSNIAVDYIRQFFSHFVKYLGPLRDEPKAIYSLAGTTDSKDIGYRGEHTAAVLEVHSKTKIKYIPSEEFETGNFSPTIIDDTLSLAVLNWLKYMGIANDFQTSDKGVLGYELKVAISDTQSLHDLTHVGVGVSQVLPILVQSLLAESGSTLIFEQPELHLHPKVQTRLADFFISMTMLNKQCIVETHSEYLINRLRYLSANSEGNQIHKDVIIYFVEKQGEKSKYRPVRINNFGVIEDWPKGFFDESEQNARAIIKAAMEKRKRNLPKNNI
jgi:predicted ATPase